MPVAVIEQQVARNRRVVARATVNLVSFLFTGDKGFFIEREIRTNKQVEISIEIDIDENCRTGKGLDIDSSYR